MEEELKDFIVNMKVKENQYINMSDCAWALILMSYEQKQNFASIVLQREVDYKSLTETAKVIISMIFGYCWCKFREEDDL